VSCACEPL